MRGISGYFALLMGGLLMMPSSSRALDPSGDADTSFSTDGYAGINVTLRNTDAGGRGMAVQSDGKILITGDYWDSGTQHIALTRYNSDGSFDSSFGVGGEVKTAVGANDVPFAVAVQSDGKIVIVGATTTSANEDYLVARYTSSGVLDTSFSGDGVFTLNAALGGNNFDRARAIAIQPDQKIVVAGYSTIGAGDERDAVVFRLGTTGVLDTTFSGDGIAYVSTSTGSTVDEGLSVAVASGGLIYLSGRTSTGGHVSRLTSAGVLDTSFDGDGIAINNPLSGTRYISIAIDASNRPVVAGGGGGSSQLIVSRFTTTGAPDTSFSGDGVFSTNILAGQSRANNIAIDSSGNIYAGGHTDTDNAGVFQFFAMRLTSAGNLDTAFSGDGKIAVDPSGSGLINSALSGGIQSDGKYLLGGSSAPAANPTAPRIALLRFTTGGVLDTTFDGDGIVFRQLQGGSVDYAYGVTADASNNLYVAGYTDLTTHSDVVVAKLSSTGTLDTTWDSDGLSLAGGTSTNEEAHGAALQSDGKLVVGVQRNNLVSPFNPRLGAFRFTSAGALDTTYSADGIAEGASFGNSAQAFGVVLDGSGRAVVFGQVSDTSTNADFAAARFTTTGALDTAFDGDGNWRLSLGAGVDGAQAATVQADGKIIFAGFTTISGAEHWALVRLTDAGVADSTFNGDGNGDGVILATEGSGNLPRAQIKHVSVLPDGKIYVLGSSNVSGANNQIRTGRFLSNGAVDTSYGTNGFATVNLGASRIDNINAGARQFDEKLIAFGAVTPSGQGTDFHLARVNWDDGSIDATYGTAGARTFAASAGLDVAYAGFVDGLGRQILAGLGNAGDLGVARFQSDPAPTPASTPDLITASDSGRSNTDNITNDNTPTFNGTCVVGETVILKVDGNDTTPRTRHLCRTTTYALTPPTMADGVYAIRVLEINGRGAAALSGTLNVTIDTVANAPTLTSPVNNAVLAIPPSPTISGAGAETDADVDVELAAGGAVCTDFADLTPVTNAPWSCASSLGLGAHTIRARQTDLAGNVSGYTANVAITLKANTTTVVTSDLAVAKYGQPVTFTATVQTVPPGFAIPTGTVTFLANAVPIGTGTLNGSGVATLTHSTLDANVTPYIITANYPEQPTFFASNDTLDGGLRIDKADTTLVLATSVNPSVFGQPLAFTATLAVVAPGGGTPTGNIAFVVDGGAPANVALAGGQAIRNPGVLAVGNHSVDASFATSTNYNASNATLSPVQTVNKATTSAAVVSGTNPSTRGQNVTFTATIAAVAPGAGTPGGTVEFFLDGSPTPSATGTLSGGSTTFSTAALSVGTHTLTISYLGDASFLASNGALAPVQTVNKGATTTSIASTVNPSTFGESVTFTATVLASAPATDTPTGTVNFVIDGGAPQAVAVNGSGVATLTTSTLTGGTHTVVANYLGDANLNASSGTLAPVQTVNAAGTTTTIGSSSNPSVFGQNVTFTATVAVVAPGTGTPTGTVNFVVDGGAPQAIALDGSGQATLSSSALTVGTHTVVATYVATANYATSNASLTPVQTVNQATTTTAITSSANPSAFGQAVTFTATVSTVAPGGGMPAGTVNFVIDGGAAVPVVLNGSGVATMTTSALTVGTHTVAANYVGNASHNGSSATLAPVQTVNQAATTATVTSGLNPSLLGENVTFTATVSATAPGAGTPTGTVQFFVDGAGAPTATATLAGGVATFSTSTLTVGTHTLTVTYVGDTNFTTSSGTLSPVQTVNRKPSTTVVASSANPSPFGDAVTFTATVTPNSPGPVATGTVEFVIDGGTPQSATLNASGQATLTTSSLSGGTHTVVANYLGDADLATSSGTLAPPQSITAATTSTAIASSANPSSFGQNVSFTATVTANVPTTGTPTGNVNFVIDGGAPQTIVLNGSGVAVFSTNALSVGNHTVAVDYLGSANHAASTTTLSPQQVVTEAASSTAVASSSNPAAQGSAITFTATVSAVSPASGTPVGSVTFVIDSVANGPIALSAGVATFTTSTLTPGTHTVIASYDGTDPNFLSSFSTLTPDQVVFPVDFGDAPAPYPTLTAVDGARHHAQGPRLGAVVDSEPEGFPSALADGDDLSASDDEDGVVFAGLLIPGQNAAVTVTASSVAMLDAWIDFNNNGNWNDPGEQVFSTTPLTVGANNLSVAVPATTVANAHVFARFRISTAGGLAFTGFAGDGEVEDYRLATSPVVDLRVTQTESIDPVVAGSGAGNLVYTVTVANLGPSAATAVALSELLTLPSGTSLVSVVPSQGSFTAPTWSVGNLAMNASATLTITLTAAGNTAIASNAICSTATVTGVTEPRLNTADDTSSECTSVTRQVDLALSQTESADPVTAGSGAGNLTYVLTVSNAGPSAATGIAVADVLTLPTGVSLVSATPSQGTFTSPTWTVGNLAVGGNASLTVVLTVGANATTGSNTICSAANVSAANETLTNTGNDSANTCTSVARQVDLRVTKTDSIDPVGAGSGAGNLTQTVTVQNLGASDASGVTLSDVFTLPSGVTVDSATPSVGTFSAPNWTLGALAAGASATLTVQMTVAASTAQGASICDTATVTGSNEPRINPADDTATECTAVVRLTDLSLSKTSNAMAIGAGQSMTYTLTVLNNGPGDATGVVVSDALPASVTVTSTSGCAEPVGVPTCTLGAIANGASKSFTIVVSVNPSPPALIINTASVTGAEPDMVGGNNSATATVSTDTVPPSIAALDTLTATPDGSLDNCETVRAGVSSFNVVFSEAMFDPPGNSSPNDVTNPANYRLLRAAPGAMFATTSCLDGPGSDIATALTITYDDTTHSAALTPASALGDGIYRLLVCRTATDPAGNLLDGGNGSGSDRVRTFRVDRDNWLDHGHFDTHDALACSSSAWTSTTPANVTQFALPDAGASPLSGSAHNTGPTAGFELTQCQPVRGSGEVLLRSAVRIDGAIGTFVTVAPRCRFYPEVGCSGTELSQIAAPVLLGPGASNFLAFNQTGNVPVDAASVRCTFTVTRTAGTAYNAYLDQLFIGYDTIFADEFE